jgi:hypothetical protein
MPNPSNGDLPCPQSQARQLACLTVDVASLPPATVSIVGGLLAAIVGGLITRGVARNSSRKERIDEYRREVRAAASAIVRTAHTLIDSANSFEKSMSWSEDAVRITPDHDESYRACQTAKVELDEKVADFTLLVDLDVLSKAATKLHINATTTYNAIATINMSPEWPKYTEQRLKAGLENIYQHVLMLEAKVVPNFRQCVYNYIPHTIVDEKRRRARRLLPFSASWRWIKHQHR